MSTTESERITALEKRLAEAEGRIAQLERERLAQQWPVNPWPTSPVSPHTEPLPNTLPDRWWEPRPLPDITCSKVTFGGPSMAEDQLPRYSSDCGSVGVAQSVESIEHRFSSIAQMEAWQRGCKNPTDWTMVPRGSWPAEYRDGTRGYPPAEIPLT